MIIIGLQTMNHFDHQSPPHACSFWSNIDKPIRNEQFITICERDASRPSDEDAAIPVRKPLSEITCRGLFVEMRIEILICICHRASGPLNINTIPSALMQVDRIFEIVCLTAMQVKISDCSRHRRQWLIRVIVLGLYLRTCWMALERGEANVAGACGTAALCRYVQVHGICFVISWRSRIPIAD